MHVGGQRQKKMKMKIRQTCFGQVAKTRSNDAGEMARSPPVLTTNRMQHTPDGVPSPDARSVLLGSLRVVVAAVTALTGLPGRRAGGVFFRRRVQVHNSLLSCLGRFDLDSSATQRVPSGSFGCVELVSRDKPCGLRRPARVLPPAAHELDLECRTQAGSIG